jgi:hypothetical protein
MATWGEKVMNRRAFFFSWLLFNPTHMSHRYREFRGQKTGDELRMERLKRMSETNALARRRAKEAARALARNTDMVKALHAWTAFCDKMAAWKRAALADDPVAWGKDLEGTVASVQRIIDMKVLNPPRLAAEAVAVQKNPQAFVVQEMRKWTQAQVQTLYPHLAALQDNYRLDDLSQRALAATLVEAAFSRATKFMLINVSIHPVLLRQNIWDAKTMLDCVLPSWSTAIVPGPTTLDPYLGLRRLRGPVTYTYLEPKPEWNARVPHLPIIILLGDHHVPKPPCVGFDVTDDDKTKEVGGTQSFWHFLDTDAALAAFTRDVVLELWVPKHVRLSTERTTKPARTRGGPLAETREFLLDCVGPVRKAAACPLPSVRVHVADVRGLYKEHPGTGYAHLRLKLHEAVEKGQNQLFHGFCGRWGWDPQQAARSLLSLAITEDLDNPQLARQRLAHEFNQLDAAVQAEIRGKLGGIAQQAYPYDLPGAVCDWLRESHRDEKIHPFVQTDMRDIAAEGSYLSNRRLMSVELYALSRMLKQPREDAKPRLAIFFAGSAHCMTAAYLLHGMYNIHGAAATPDDSGCLDFSNPTNGCFDADRACLRTPKKTSSAHAIQEPQRPISWVTNKHKP